MAVLFSECFFRPLLRSNVLSTGTLAHMSTAPYLMASRNKPRGSGDKGPEKNYQKKMAKKANKDNFPMKNDNGKWTNTGSKSKPMHALMEGLKDLEGKGYEPAQNIQ